MPSARPARPSSGARSPRAGCWSPDSYDDGGLSGGTLERPALQRLLADIRDGRVDIVVVYKVDRLTRSLADFAKLVETFDEAGASFVSVTQHFNTSTSMGRLTLNMLLSFAQFEREVTAERIRDKIAASKQRGMWMGGPVPLGYDAIDRKLVVNETEAETVRQIYDRYLALGSIRPLKTELDRAGIVSKTRTTRTGRQIGRRPFTRGALVVLLRNPLYIGEVQHKGERFPGQHAPIVDPGELGGGAAAPRSPEDRPAPLAACRDREPSRRDAVRCGRPAAYPEPRLQGAGPDPLPLLHLEPAHDRARCRSPGCLAAAGRAGRAGGAGGADRAASRARAARA